MKKIINVILLLSARFLLMACPESFDEADAELIIINKSDRDIYFWERGRVPELSKPNHHFLIPANSRISRNEAFKKSLSDGSKLYIWLFDSAVIDSVPWEEVVANDMCLVRYDLTLQDLEAMNWIVVYEGE